MLGRMQHVIPLLGLCIECHVNQRDELVVRRGGDLVGCLSLREVQCKGTAKVLDVAGGLELGNASGQHHGEEGDEEFGLPPQGHVGLGAGLFKALEEGRGLAAQNTGVTSLLPGILRREHKGRPLSVDAKLLLPVAQEVAKVDVKEMALPRDHDVV